jgi:hypothetical protein
MEDVHRQLHVLVQAHVNEPKSELLVVHARPEDPHEAALVRFPVFDRLIHGDRLVEVVVELHERRTELLEDPLQRLLQFGHELILQGQIVKQAEVQDLLFQLYAPKAVVVEGGTDENSLLGAQDGVFEYVAPLRVRKIVLVRVPVVQHLQVINVQKRCFHI